MFLTSINADKRALSDIIQTPDAPAFVLSLKELKAYLQAVLHQPVGAHLSTTFAPFITLVDPERTKKNKGMARSEVIRSSTEDERVSLPKNK